MTEQNDLTVKQQILHTISTLPDNMLTYLQRKLTLEFEIRAACKSIIPESSKKLTEPAKPGSSKRCIKQHAKAQLRKIQTKNKNNPKIYNSNNLVSLRAINEPLHIRRAYYKSLMKQDWTAVYPDDNSAVSAANFYVYAHVNPNKFSLHTGSSGGAFAGTPFYIGKGCGDRAFDLKRNQGHGKEIRTYLDRGYEKKDIVNILYSDLTEPKAFEIEAKLIYFFGTIYEKQRRQTCLYNLNIPKTPDFIGAMVEIKK